MEVTRIFDILDKIRINFPNKSDVLAAKENQQWVKYSIEQYISNADAFSFGLLRRGFLMGDKIGTVSNNRPEWNFVDMGMSQIGVIHVPIYPTISDDDFLYILTHSQVRMLIVASTSLYSRLLPLLSKLPQKCEIFTFDKISNANHWTEIIKTDDHADEISLRKEIEHRKSLIKPNDMTTLIYTSGTTGLSKGVMLSHENFLYQSRQFAKFIQVDHRHKALSFLPLCHVLERICCYSFQYLGISIYYAENTARLAENMKEIGPHVIVTVPRLLEKVYDKIIAKGSDLPKISRTIFNWAVKLGLDFDLEGTSFWYKVKLFFADLLIYRKWRAALGGNLMLVICGGAALQPRLAKSFWAAKIPVQEGYGLTETAPVITFNHLRKPDIRLGTVGPLLGEEQKLKIAEDGEILFKGPNLMLGYYNDEERTNEAIDKDGFFHTGDIGVFEENKFLRITDRKKEIFKLSTGKYIAPQPIENVFKESSFIEQMMVIGENEKFAAALISPAFEYLHDWCHQKKIRFRENEDLVEIPEVLEKYRQEIKRFNQRIGKSEQIITFRLVCEQWTPDSGELSPTLKLKRKYISQKYQHLIDEIYKNSKDDD